MVRGVLCQCGCKSIITEINPDTNRPYARCPKSRVELHKSAATRRNIQRKESMDHARISGNRLIYDTQRWKRLSEKKKIVNPYCEECLAEGRYTLVDVVDHEVEIRDDPTLAFRFDNLKSLCHHHHNNKTAKEKRIRNNETYI